MAVNTNLRNRPEVTEFAEEREARGPAQLDAFNAYLRNDPVSMFHQQFRDDGNELLDDRWWAEASRRGESEMLVGLLRASEDAEWDRTAINAVLGYGDFVDFDAYMLALQIPLLDNENRTVRADENQYDENGNLVHEGSGYVFGEYTDQEWAWQILDNMMNRWDAQIIEENKANRNFFVNLAANIGGGIVMGATNILAGALNFIGNVWDIGAGIFEVLWHAFSDISYIMNRDPSDILGEDVSERPVGWERFMRRFSSEADRNAFAVMGEWLQAASFEFQRLYMGTVDAVAAHDQGYRFERGSNFLQRVSGAQGVGVGHTTSGRWFNGVTNAIGFMVPTMVLAVATKGTSVAVTGGKKSIGAKAAGAGRNVARAAAQKRTLIYYTGIVSGSIRDNVAVGEMNGLSYRDLNAGLVIGNAVIRAGASFAVAKGLGAVMGYSGVDNLIGIGGKSTQAVATRTSEAAVRAARAASTGGLAVATEVARRAGRSMLKEGLENVLQDLSGHIIDYAFGSHYRERAQERFSVQGLVDGFVIGAMTTVVIGSVTEVMTRMNETARGQALVGMNQQGETFKLGAFRTATLRQATKTMNSWMADINNANLSVDQRAAVLFQLEATTQVLGDLYRNMGVERAIRADALLKDVMNMETKQERINAFGTTAVDYASTLWNNFTQAQQNASAQYVQAREQAKIKRALERESAKLKRNKVSEITDVVTMNTNTNDPNIPVEQASLVRLQNAFAKLGVDAIVGTDGNIVSKSQDILIVPRQFLEDGNIAAIVQGAAYDMAIETTKSKLTTPQQNLILRIYNEATGLAGHLDDALTALLFDKQFYTLALLSKTGRVNRTKLLGVLSTIDQLIKGRIESRGQLTNQAYRALLKKIQETMRAGLITFATHHQMLDLDTISIEVLPPAIKAEILNHQNVRFTQMINEAAQDKARRAPTSARVDAFNTAIDQYIDLISPNKITELKNKAASADPSQRLDAYMFLAAQSVLNNDLSEKAIYLPSNITNANHYADVQLVAETFGVEWQSLLQGTYNANQLSQEAIDLIRELGVDMAVERERFVAIREVLFNKSAGALTIGNDGTLLQVLPMADVLKSQYLAENGQTQLYNDLRDGTIKTLADISKITLDARLAGLELAYAPSEITGDNMGQYVSGSNKILLRGPKLATTIMHEATHFVQDILNLDQGGNVGMFDALPQSVKDSISKYIQGHFPSSFELMQQENIGQAQMIYFMLSGELQANSTISSILFDVGFTFNSDRTMLIAPDGVTQWSLTPRGLSGTVQELTKEAKVVNENRPLTLREQRDLMERSDVREFMTRQDAALMSRGTPIVFYRGTIEVAHQLSGEGDYVPGAVWFSSDAFVGTKYAGADGSLVGYVSNLTADDLLFLNVNNQSAMMITRPNGKITNTFDLVRQVREQFPNKKGVVIQNVIEAGTGTPANTLVVFDQATENVLQVTEPDGGQFVNDWFASKGVSAEDFERFQTEHLRRAIHTVESANLQRSRNVPNKKARESNLKYFIRERRPIQMAPNLQDFVIATTTNFDQLSSFLQNHIKNGTLNLHKISEYVATARSINQYTWESIARFIYQNEAAAQITHNQMLQFADRIQDLASFAVLAGEAADAPLTFNQMLEAYDNLLETARTNPSVQRQLLKARRGAENVRIGTEYIEAHADPLQLATIFMRHFDGTLASLQSINNIGKLVVARQELQRFSEAQDTSTTEGQTAVWNWLDNMRRAEIEYDAGLSRTEMQDALNDAVTEELARAARELPREQLMSELPRIQAEQAAKLAEIESLSDADMFTLYISTMGESMAQISETAQALAQAPVERSESSLRQGIRQTAATLSRRLGGYKSRFNKLPEAVKEILDPSTMTINESAIADLDRTQLESLLSTIKSASRDLAATARQLETAQRQAATAQRRLERLQARNLKIDNKGRQVQKREPRTMREKVQTVHTTRVINQTFTFDSRVASTNTVTELFNTQWGRQKMSKVQGITNNQENNVYNGKTFFEHNANTLISMDKHEVENTARWFLDANPMGMAADSSDAQAFQAIKLYFLGFVYGQTGSGLLFDTLDANLKTQIENNLRNTASAAGTALSVWKNVQDLINPIDTMVQASMEIGGVMLTETEKSDFLQAAIAGDVDAIRESQQRILERVMEQSTSKQSVTRVLASWRRMAMLSSPMTMLRNRISNISLKRLNSWSSKIGNKMFAGQTEMRQLKMTAEVTTDITNFINENFLDNQLFDTLVGQISRYNPSTIKRTTAGQQASAETILADMALQAVYGQFYSETTFNNAGMNKVHTWLMERLSDNNYVREASVRYFGRMLAELNIDLTKGRSDAVMNTFAKAVGQGMRDYLHTSNIVNDIEKMIQERGGETAWFAYKLILPFAAAGWNWFKEGIRFTPVGLGRAIFKINTLENQIIKAENAWSKGQSQVAPELTEFNIRRDLGAGAIGTAALCFGMLLAGFGFVSLEEEDRGTPKLRIGNMRIDISSIFGTSSVLAGMALAQSLRQDESIMGSLNAALDPLLDGFFMTEIMNMNMFRSGPVSGGVQFAEATILSMIPNASRWLSGALHPGTFAPDNLFQRAVTRIPFLGSAFGVQRRVDPFTGEEGGWLDAFNRTMPFVSVRQISAAEERARELGITRNELRGNYTINGEEFNLNARQTAELNRQFGQWNAAALTRFYNNQSRHRVQMPNGTFRELTYSQMTDEQRARATQNIINQNASSARIAAWLQAGNIFYASAAEFQRLRALGITTNLRRGNQGFVMR